MDKIQIYETDSTLRSAKYNVTMNAVFIPGFITDPFKAAVGEDIDPSTTYYTKTGNYYTKVSNPEKEQISTYFVKDIEFGKPILFTSGDDFENTFGKEPYKFKENQTNYPYYIKDSYDLSYIYAKELLRYGLYVYYYPVDIYTKDSIVDDKIVDELYNDFAKALEIISDKNIYNVKFLTSGGYPMLESQITTSINTTQYYLPQAMLYWAASRGDSVALIDYTYQSYMSALKIWEKVADVFDGDGESNTTFKIVTGKVLVSEGNYLDHTEDIRNYGALITCNMTQKLYASYGSVKPADISPQIMPGSFEYLACFAQSVQNNPNYYAIAGVTRGSVRGVEQPTLVISGNEANSVQPEKQQTLTIDKKDVKSGIAINPIINITQYGYCIWGNRTLHVNETELVASSFLNTRLMACDVKKIVRDAALSLNFELISDVLWINFKSLIEPELDKMISNNGLEKYKLTRLSTTERGTVKAKITLWCVYAAEKWDIEVELTDSYVSVE